MPRPEKLQTERGGGSEVHLRSSRRNFVSGEQRPAVQFKIRSHVAAGGKVPLQPQRIYSCAVRRVRGLEYQVRRNRINGKLKPAFEKSGKNRLGQDPAVAEPRVPDAGISASASDGMPPGR